MGLDFCCEKRTVNNSIQSFAPSNEQEIPPHKFISTNDSYFEVVRENWDDEHKIVRCHKRYWEYVDDGKTYYYGSRPRKWITTGETCDVDLVTGRITG